MKSCMESQARIRKEVWPVDDDGGGEDDDSKDIDENIKN